MPDRMMAAYVTELGPPETIRVGELPVPEPGPAEALIAVEAVAVNPVDTFVRSGRYRTAIPFPFIVGRDLAGTVVRTGSALPGFRPGDRVWCDSLGHDGRQGATAQFAIVPGDRLYPIPPAVDPVTVAAVAHPAATAYLAWFEHGGLRPGQTVYVGGGAGNVGTAAVRMAARAGARVIATARPEDHARCQAAGASLVYDYRSPDLTGHLREAAPEGLDIYWDTSGHNDFDQACRLLRTGGRILLTAGLTHGAVPLPVAALYTRDVSLHGFVISHATTTGLARAARLINTLLAAGDLPLPTIIERPLSATAEAHRHLEQGTMKGRSVIRPDAG
jgi:NADPH:quinone reductase-like Zn-dependent oxidoreductase